MLLRHVAAALLIALGAPCAAHAACPIEIVGTWKSTGPEPRLLSFAPDGWANVLSAELDILAQVQYEFVPRREPRRVGFLARRGNDIFPSGSSSWEIVAHSDESFSARSPDDTEQSHWTRVQTHRYFVTFAARGDATLFVMWTTLNGGRNRVEALGLTTRDTEARFGRIPQELTSAFVKQSERADEAMLRMELSEAEYRRTHQVFLSWDTLIARGLLAREDPRRQAALLTDATIQSVNRCGKRMRAPGEISRPLDLVREIRRLNDRAHVPDKAYPFRWTPSPPT